MNYPLPDGWRDQKWEERYQAAVARALQNYEGQAVLLAPRRRMRGWGWKHYNDKRIAKGKK